MKELDLMESAASSRVYLFSIALSERNFVFVLLPLGDGWDQ